MRLPTIKELSALLRGLKPRIEDGFGDREEGELPYLEVHVGWDPETGEGGWQTGDFSFIGNAYGYPTTAGVHLYRRSNCKELARDIRRELDEQTVDTVSNEELT